ncbi:hypothetical protein GHK50_21080 [Sinorhizobium medicae]|uniref:SIR2-like domain-containing protein n=1 Tax=Sinorhizobium medicae TaxID=110321 RepID=A0A6G1WV27_9HYPH|nr:hypothetical protein [Sinorhizobium medicae]MQW73465.1 hypothetical protein [Sinorhizobium medicae]MQX85560.1 hypothetical protein [Sinorhizobium medicae]
MFEGNVVFVVGAGGSFDFGFPMGEQLKDQIANKLSIRFRDSGELAGGDPQVVEALRALARRKGLQSINPFLQSARSIASAMPQAISIDNFLHTHADEPDLVLIGKIAIAASILDAEGASKIYMGRDKHSFDFSETKNVWHNTFCKILTENVQRSSIDNLFDNVSFITFNYDRCIEHYISNWLSNYMLVSLEEAQEWTSRLTVFHPYGQVGRLPWQQSADVKVPFGGRVDASDLIAVAEQIRTFTERVESDSLAPIRARIANADMIVYLGFSYGRMNLELLAIDSIGPSKRVIGTAFGISEQNKSAIVRQLLQSLAVPVSQGSYDLVNMTCSDLLNAYWRVLGG